MEKDALGGDGLGECSPLSRISVLGTTMGEDGAEVHGEVHGDLWGCWAGESGRAGRWWWCWLVGLGLDAEAALLGEHRSVSKAMVMHAKTCH